MFLTTLVLLLQHHGGASIPDLPTSLVVSEGRRAELEDDSSDAQEEFLPYLRRSDLEAERSGDASQDFGHAHDSFPGFFKTHGSSTAWREFVWNDYLTQPAVLIPLGIGVTAAIVSHWDKPWEKKLRGTMGGNQTIGNVTLYTLLGGALLSGVLFPGPGRNGWDQLFNEGEAFGATALTTTVLKETVRRPRPFEGGGSVHSFPSGHSSGAFAAATLIERNSGELAAIPAYSLAALTAYSRVDAARHYPSDVLAGAAIGILTARIFDGLHWGVGEKGGIARLSAEVAMDTLGHGELLLQLGVTY
jgi:PAP2 superfamily